MLNSNIANTQLALDLTNNYRLSRNIPIDTRFLVKSLLTIDTEIPISKRYNGLIFFVTEDTYTHGPTDTIVGKFYCFEDDLTKPVPLYKVFDRYEILQITGYRNNTWANLISDLDLTYPKNGRCVFIEDLNIFVVYRDGIWYYVSGEYNISKAEDWITVPDSLKVPERIVRIGTGISPLPTTSVTHIIMNDLTLGVIVIPLPALPTNPGDVVIQDNHYYLVDGLLYIYLDGEFFNIHDGIYIEQLARIQPGPITINHGLNTPYILANIRINNNISTNTNKVNPELPTVLVLPVDCQIINNNTVQIENSLSFEFVTIMLIKKHINL